MLRSYAAPPQAAKSEDNQRAILSEIADAILTCAPKDWSHERLEVFGKRVWHSILARHFGAHWVKPDVAMKAAREVHADMTAYDDRQSAMPERQLMPPQDGPLLGEESDFMAKYPRLKAKVDGLAESSPCKPLLAKLLDDGLRRHQARHAMAAE